MLNIQPPRPAVLPGQLHHPVSGALPAAEGLKNKTHSEKHLQELATARTHKSELGQLGSKAHLQEIKARIEQVPVGDLQVRQERLNKLGKLKKYAGATAHLMGKGIRKAPTALGSGLKSAARYPLKPIINAVQHHREAKSLRQSAKDCEAKAAGLEKFASALRSEAFAYARMANPHQGPEGPLLQKSHTLLDSADKFSQNAADSRRAAALFRQQAKAVGSRKKLAGDVLVEGTGVASKMATAAKMGVQIAEKSALLANAGTATGATLTLAGTASGIGIATSAVSAVMETKELISSAKTLKGALNRREAAKALLTDQAGREAMIQKLESEASAAASGGKLRRSNPAKAAALLAKAEALKGINAEVAAGKPIADETRAVAEQIVKRTDKKFKIAKIARHALGVAAGVAGVVAGAAAIAVLAGSMATPVGWAIAGVAIGLSVAAVAGVAGLAIYSKVKANRRANKIALAENNHSQTQAKLALLKEKAASFSATERAHPAGKAELARIQTQIAALEGLQKDNIIQLMAASPERAARLIYDGARAGDPALSYLASQVLKVPDIGQEAESVALARLAAGMSIHPAK